MTSRAKQAQLLDITPDQAEYSDSVISGIRFGMSNLKKLIHETLPKCPTDDLRKSMATRMETLVLNLVKAEMTYTKAAVIVNEVVEEMPDYVQSDAMIILKSCDRISDESMERIGVFEENLTEDELKQQPTYISLKEDIDRLLLGGCVPDTYETNQEEDEEDEEEEEEEEEQEDDDDEDVEAMVSEEDLIPVNDPVTKKLLEDPVRNKNCGHVYGKASISQLIRSNKKTKCPMAGCSNNNFLRLNQLITDPKLTAKVLKKQKEMNKNKKKR